MFTQLNIDDLRQFQIPNWGREVVASGLWAAMCDNFSSYKAPERTLKLGNPERKWEVGSAYQKSIRRADPTIALRMVSAMASFPTEWNYYMRRLCTTVCEDIGPGDIPVMLFTIVCSKLFTPSKVGEQEFYRIMCFLTEQACMTPRKSRTYCELSIIEENSNATGYGFAKPYAAQTRELLATCEQRKMAPNEWAIWVRKNDWRGERMLRYVLLDLPETKLKFLPRDIPAPTLQCGLPSYAYDKHTRVGLAALSKLWKQPDFGKQVAKLKAGSPSKAIGWALFFAEGGRIKDELSHPSIQLTERDIVAKMWGLEPSAWIDLVKLVEDAVWCGEMDLCREQALREAYK